MKLVLLFGNTAVGKMTVGQELAKLTGLRLFNNHMTIEPVLEIFGKMNHRAIDRLRGVIFEEFAHADQYGMIFTFMWAFNLPEEWEYVEWIKSIFSGDEICYVELRASREVRLQRNRTENRLKHKASKRDIEASERRLLRNDEQYRCESLEGEITFPNYLCIDNTNLLPEEAAERIRDHFNL